MLASVLIAVAATIGAPGVAICVPTSTMQIAVVLAVVLAILVAAIIAVVTLVVLLL